MSRKSKDMALIARTATNLTFKRALPVYWPSKVLCTSKSTKGQIESDIIASIYEFIECGKMDNLVYSLLAAKNSKHIFKKIKSLEPCERPNKFSAKMFITFFGKGNIKVIFRMHIFDEKNYLKRNITSSKIEDIHNVLCDEIRSEIQEIERIYSESSSL